VAKREKAGLTRTGSSLFEKKKGEEKKKLSGEKEGTGGGMGFFIKRMLAHRVQVLQRGNRKGDQVRWGTNSRVDAAVSRKVQAHEHINESCRADTSPSKNGVGADGRA